MRRVVLIGMIMGLFWGTGAMAADTQVGYLNVLRVAEESPQAAAASKSLEDEFAPRQKDLRAKADQLSQLEDKYKRDASVMSEAERGRLERDILQRQRKLKSDEAEFRDEVSLRKNEEQRKLIKLVSEVVQEVAKEGGYDLIVTDGIAYASKKVDVSEKVLQRLKEKYKSR